MSHSLQTFWINEKSYQTGQNWCRLNISVDDILFMKIQKSLIYFKNFSENFNLWKFSSFFLNSLYETSWFHVFEYHVEIYDIIKKTIKLNNMWMTHFHLNFNVMYKFVLKLMRFDDFLLISFYGTDKTWLSMNGR